MPVKLPRTQKLTPEWRKNNISNKNVDTDVDLQSEVINDTTNNNVISTHVETVSIDDTIVPAATTVGIDLTYDPAFFRPAESVSRASIGSGTGAVTIVKTPNNGNRITISAAIMAALGNPDTVQVQIGSETVAIATEFAASSPIYRIKKTGRKGVIYNAALVREVVEALSLDFDNRTTVTLYRSKIFDNDGTPIAVVKQ